MTQPQLERVIREHTPDALVIVDRAGLILHWSAAASDLFGYAPAEADGRALEDLIVAAHQQEEFAALLQAAAAHGMFVDESVRHRKDGSRMQISSAAKAVRSAAGDLECFVITHRDVTSLKAAREVKVVETRFRDLLEHTPDAILIVNITGRIVLANSQSEGMFGHSRDQLIGQPVEVLLPIRYRRAHLGHRAHFFEQPRTRAMGTGVELFGVRSSGEEFPVEVSLSPLMTEEGQMVMCAVRDVSARREARQKSDRKFRDLLESAPDAMVIVDARGEIVLVNSQTVQLFGWRREELMGRPIETLVPQRFRGAHVGHRAGYFGQLKMRQMGAGLELYGLRKDNSEFPVEISLSPIQTEEGLLVASAIRDASDRRRSEQILQETNRIKSEFLANMSHELRTPLNGILGFSELLVDQRFGPLNDKQREYIHDIHECGKHLLQLINDVLDLSKVEAGKMDVYPETFAPASAVNAVFSVILPLARKKHVRLNPLTGTGVDSVLLDIAKFKQILFNLLSNAVKFTDPGGNVYVSLDPVEPDRMRLSVRDTGIGISAANMGRLFDAFQQLDSSASRRHEGTGLGLTLTRRLVELQGGTIDVESEEGVGSTFTVYLPRAATKAASGGLPA